MPSSKNVQHHPALGFRVWKNHISQRSMLNPHTHSDVEINFLREGALYYIHAGKPIEVEAGQTAIFWGAIPHQLLDARKNPWGIWITFPLQWLLEWKLPHPLLQSLLSGNMLLSHQSVFTPSWEHCLRWESDFQSKSPHALEATRLEIQASFHRLAGENQAPPYSSAKGHSLQAPSSRILLTALQFIAQHYSQPIQVSDVAEHLRLHPNYLQQYFREVTGFPLWDYVTRLRVAHAQRLLLTTSRNILDIALESGFGSQSSFYRSFFQYTQQSPAKYRKDYRSM